MLLKMENGTKYCKILYTINMVCFRYLISSTLHKHEYYYYYYYYY